MRRALWSWGLIVLAARGAWADENATIAEALYRDASEAFKAGRIAEACPKFAESQRLDPQRGTLANLARCHEREGRVSAAWSDYVQLAELAKRFNDEARATYAQQRIAELEPKLPRVQFASGAGPKPKELKVDDKTLSSAVLGTTFPVDAGDHRVKVVAEDGQTWEQQFVAYDGKTVVVTLHPLDKAPPPSPPPQIVPPTNDTTSAPSRKWQRPVALGVGAVGVAGLVVGAVTGGLVLAKKGDVDANCTGKVCNAKGFAAQGDAWTMSTVSTIAFVAGGVLVAAGAVLFFTAPRREKTVAAISPLVGPGFGGASLEATW
jgi:hypothetical protein